jgi:hypothetical protein
VFFFDEAHLLFTGASGDFLTQVTQTVRTHPRRRASGLLRHAEPEGRAR